MADIPETRIESTDAESDTFLDESEEDGHPEDSNVSNEEENRSGRGVSDIENRRDTTISAKTLLPDCTAPKCGAPTMVAEASGSDSSSGKQKGEDATRRALKMMDEGGPPPPLLKFFLRQSKEERAKKIKEEDEERSKKAEEAVKKQQLIKAQKAEEHKRNTMLQKRKSRTKQKEREIEAGVQDFNGKKRRKTSKKLQRDVDHVADNIAKLSRPAREIKREHKDKMKKKSGRKQVHERTNTTYTNWLTPFCWTKSRARPSKLDPACLPLILFGNLNDRTL
ncbi:hypothetical protein PM082_018322 [Marasmius tenuissimus]|nr:hypothetical protein PM082_018322 [Marasmius tenuissimus]